MQQNTCILLHKNTFQIEILLSPIWLVYIYVLQFSVKEKGKICGLSYTYKCITMNAATHTKQWESSLILTLCPNPIAKKQLEIEIPKCYNCSHVIRVRYITVGKNPLTTIYPPCSLTKLDLTKTLGALKHIIRLEKEPPWSRPFLCHGPPECPCHFPWPSALLSPSCEGPSSC